MQEQKMSSVIEAEATAQSETETWTAMEVGTVTDKDTNTNTETVCDKRSQRQMMIDNGRVASVVQDVVSVLPDSDKVEQTVQTVKAEKL